MKCPKCHFDNPSDSKFCKECGTQLAPSEEIPVSYTKTLETPVTSKEITVSFTLKKIFVPALIIALIITGLILWRPWSQKEAPKVISEKPSIAVLPFEDLSPQKDQEYFCDGMTDEIIAKLSALKELKIISRTSVMRYKETDKDIKEIGQELDVEKLLDLWRDADPVLPEVEDSRKRLTELKSQ